MNHSGILHDILIFLVAAVVIVPLFARLRISSILGYLAAGVLIGPNGLTFIGDTQSANTLAEFGVVFLLFTIGLDLSLERLHAMGRYVFGLGLTQVVVTGLVIGIMAWRMGLDIKAAAIVGGALALSSTAFVLQLLSERGERSTRFGYFSFAILLLQDLAVVPLLIMVTIFSQEGISLVTAFGLSIVKATIALIVATWAGRLILRPLFHMISSVRNSELLVVMALLSALGTGWLLSLAGLSMALGAFLAGILLGETEFKHQVEADIKPFRGLLLGLFFMTIGMTIDMSFILTHLGLIALLVTALLIGKTIITSLLCRAFGIPADKSIKVGMALSQGGEFGFVIFSAAGALNLIPMETVQILLAVITLGMVATPALFQIGDWISDRLETRSEKDAGVFDIEPEEKNGQVLIAGFGRVGQTIAKLLTDVDIPYIAIDIDRNRVKECRAREMPIYFGDANQLSVLGAAGVEHARAIVITLDQVKSVNQIVLQLHNKYPDLQIFVRALDMKHLRKLETVGATATVPETVEASLALGTIVMNSLGIGNDLSATIIENYRADDYTQLEDIVGRSEKLS